VRFTITPLGGAGRAVTKIVDAIVRYLTPHTVEPTAPGGPGPGGGEAGPARYYADGGEEPGRWRGQGTHALGLAAEVTEGDLATVLAGRDPATGARLVRAQGSAGRRPKLGVGAETRRSPAGLALYDPTDAAAVLGLPAKQIHAMLDAGTTVALSRLFAAADGLPAQPEGSYLVPIVDPTGDRWVSEAELSRCEAALQAGTAPDEIGALGPPGELLSIAEAARLAGVTPRYLRRLAQRHETNTETIDARIAEGGRPRQAYLAAQRDAGGRWLVRRDELAAYLDRRRPPAVRVGYDLTLTTEKSLGVLALLSSDPTRRAVLDAIRSGNDRALDWLEQHAAITRVNGKPVPTTGWAIASFRHLTSRALLTVTHRVRDPHDRAAADALRAGDIAAALDYLDTAGHLHIVADEFDFYRQALTRWWAAQQAGQEHPIVDRRNTVRHQLNRLAHQLLQATGHIGQHEITASSDRRFSVGDRVIARVPDRDLHPPGQANAYVRNGAVGTVLALHPGARPVDDTITVAFDGIGTIDVPRGYFDGHRTAAWRGRRDIGLDHAYAVTSYAVQGATRAVSTSRIDPTATRAEAYVDITRGQADNHLYLTRPHDPLDGEALPAIPPPPIDDAVARRLARSIGDLTAWELHQASAERTLRRGIEAIRL
jgi:TrwC relaxase